MDELSKRSSSEQCSSRPPQGDIMATSSPSKDNVTGGQSSNSSPSTSSQGTSSSSGSLPGQWPMDGMALKKTISGLTNMAIAHEIAVNKDFALTRRDLTADSSVSLFNRKSDAVIIDRPRKNDKFWEEVQQFLGTPNPDLRAHKELIMQLVRRFKEALEATLLPHNVNVKQRINEFFEVKEIEKQIEHDAFHFEHYMNFILNVLKQLCSPARDGEIKEVTETTQPWAQVRKIFDVMENMNLDMANFVISQSRGIIIQHCAAYERTKFVSYLAMEYRMKKDGLEMTRAWITRVMSPGASFNSLLGYMFTEILEWTAETPFPETLALDEKRISDIWLELKRLGVVGAVVRSSFEYARHVFTEYDDVESRARKDAKLTQLLATMTDAANAIITPADMSSPELLSAAVEGCAMEMLRDTEEFAAAENLTKLTDQQKVALMGMVKANLDDNHHIRVWIRRSLSQWVFSLIENRSGPVVAPASLKFLGEKLEEQVTKLISIAFFNVNVYQKVYEALFNGSLPPPVFVETSNDSVDIPLFTMMLKLDGNNKNGARLLSHMDNRMLPIFLLEGSSTEPLSEEEAKWKSLLEAEPTLPCDLNGVAGMTYPNFDTVENATVEQLIAAAKWDDAVQRSKLQRIETRLEQSTIATQTTPIDIEQSTQTEPDQN